MRKLTTLLLLVLLLTFILPAAAQEAQPTATPEAPLVVAPELFVRASEAFDAANYERAVLDYSLFLLFNPTATEAYRNRALSYQGLGDVDPALNDITQALSLTSAPASVAELYFVRANLYLQKDEIDSALTDLNASIEASPDMVSNLILRGRVYAFQKRYDDALTDYNQALELNPENVQGLIDRAFVYNAQAEFDAAITDVTTAIDLNPENSSLYLLRGSMNAQAEYTTDAASDYLRYLKLTQTRENSSTRAITSNQSFIVEMSEGVVYSIPFEAEAGKALNITATRDPEGEVDPLLVIVSESGSALVADDDSGGNMDASIQNYVIPQDGRYTLLVGHAQGGANGDILVEMNFGQ